MQPLLVLLGKGGLKSRLENLFVALDIKDEARKKALMLHYGGEQLSDVFCIY